MDIMDLQGDPFLTVVRLAPPNSVVVPPATDISSITIAVFQMRDLRVGMKTSRSVPIPTMVPVGLEQSCQMMPLFFKGGTSLSAFGDGPDVPPPINNIVKG